MAVRLGAAAGVLLILTALSASSVSATSGERAALLASFRRPAAIPFPAGNPYSRAKASLGRALFFDPILSGPRTRSCATCHIPALSWADGRPRAAALEQGDMQLRTPTLLDIAWVDRLGWDGKFRSLEGVTFKPIVAPANMNLPEAEAIARLAASPDYVEAFAEAFPDAGGVVTRAHVEQAIATFERLLVAEPAPFDRWAAGDRNAIPPAAKRGFELFTGKANCAACHSEPAFTDGSFHDIGSAKDDDIGRGRYFPGSQALLYAFKTPTLRDAARRTSFMHDGSLPTLAAVIDLYDRGGIDRPSRSRDMRPLNLSASEKADLVAFLETLSSPTDTHRALGALPHEPYRP